MNKKKTKRNSYSQEFKKKVVAEILREQKDFGHSKWKACVAVSKAAHISPAAANNWLKILQGQVQPNTEIATFVENEGVTNVVFEPSEPKQTPKVKLDDSVETVGVIEIRKGKLIVTQNGCSYTFKGGKNNIVDTSNNRIRVHLVKD